MKIHFVRKMGSFFIISLLFESMFGLTSIYSQTHTNMGIKPLVELEKRTIHDLLSSTVQPLISQQEIEAFLKNLEGQPPDWSQLRHTDIAQQSEQLFQFNRQKDAERRDKTTILNQPVAFLWEGVLRHYVPEFEGFSLALGPRFTHTSWGIIRFKPINLPDYLIAVPSLKLRDQLITRQKDGDHIDILLVCIGIPTTDESLIYGFSHDSPQDGLILPVVSVQQIMYVFKQS